MKKFWVILILLLVPFTVNASEPDMDIDIFGGIHTFSDSDRADIYGEVPTLGIRAILWTSDTVGFGISFENRSSEESGSAYASNYYMNATAYAKVEFTETEFNLGVFFRPAEKAKVNIYGGFGLAILNLDEEAKVNVTLNTIYGNRSASAKANYDITSYGAFGLIGIEFFPAKSNNVAVFAEIKGTMANSDDTGGNKDVQVGGVSLVGGIRF